ncbi:hypothetical protein Tco_0219108 [Tanacetum coccineum]
MIKISDSRLKAQHQFPAIDEVLCFFKHNLGHRFFLGYGGLPAWHRNRLVGGGNERNWVNDGLGKRVRPVSCDGGVFEEMAGKGVREERGLAFPFRVQFCRFGFVFRPFLGYPFLHNTFSKTSVSLALLWLCPSQLFHSESSFVVLALFFHPILVRKFYVVSHFAVVENMDGYRDQDMGDIILGERFCKASCVEARRFDGLITIHNGNDNVTYQIA